MAILMLQAVIEYLDLGVLECWSTGVLGVFYKDLIPSATTPTLHDSITPIRIKAKSTVKDTLMGS